ncbi:MAG: hypothetical protein IKT39_02575 [Clostridia bacterium]|nr:hypothetical protein [Clostridia bacterium]
MLLETNYDLIPEPVKNKPELKYRTERAEIESLLTGNRKSVVFKYGSIQEAYNANNALFTFAKRKGLPVRLSRRAESVYVIKL